jgi:hypothetical protein
MVEDEDWISGIVSGVGVIEDVTMSQSQSAIPPGVASTAVCGE